MRILKTIHEDYLRSLMFGLQDGLVSTTGVVVGISTGISEREIIVLAAFVAVTVEATSMAAGQYSSEKAVHQMDKSGKHTDSLIIGALVMFLSYLAGGAIPIFPTLFFNQPEGRYLAIAFSLIGIFVIGLIKGKIVEHRPLRSAIELLVISIIAIGIGIVVGQILRI